jgi:hypothetical protein
MRADKQRRQQELQEAARRAGDRGAAAAQRVDDAANRRYMEGALQELATNEVQVGAGVDRGWQCVSALAGRRLAAVLQQELGIRQLRMGVRARGWAEGAVGGC